MELGSNFELDISSLQKQEDNIFQYLAKYHAVYMDSGRSAAAVLCKLLKPGTLLFPSYLCESALQAYREKFTLRFYHVNSDLTIDWEDLEQKLGRDVTAVYLMHYFGQLQKPELLERLLEQKQRYKFTVIEDTTHSIFTKTQTIGDYGLCSLRKWFPVPDGGVLYSSSRMENITPDDYPVQKPSARLDAMILKNWYIKAGIDCNALYREIFAGEEEKLDRQKQPYQISAIAKTLLKYFSVTTLMERRKRNYKLLESVLQGTSIRPVLEGNDFVPLAYPVYLKERDEFRRYLMEHQVYCAVHWPTGQTEFEKNGEAAKMSEHMLSLPVDQRYGQEHMQYMKDLIWEYERAGGR